MGEVKREQSITSQDLGGGVPFKILFELVNEADCHVGLEGRSLDAGECKLTGEAGCWKGIIRQRHVQHRFYSVDSGLTPRLDQLGNLRTWLSGC
jgi:hypothetical protein